MSVSSARTLLVPAASQGVSPLSPSIWWPMAELNSALDYSLDWSTVFADVDDTVATVQVSIAPSGSGELETVAISVAGSVTTFWMSEGVPGRVYIVYVKLGTMGGRTITQLVGLRTDPRLAVWPPVAPENPDFGAVVSWSTGAVVFPPPDFIETMIATGLEAAGTDQASALPIPSQTSVFTSVPAGTGTRLEAVVGWGNYRIVNATENDLLVYPPGTSQIGSYGAGVPVMVAGNQTVDFATSAPATQWFAT
jgi:hypothetical protein